MTIHFKFKIDKFLTRTMTTEMKNVKSPMI